MAADENCNLIDLTHVSHHAMPVWPDSQPYAVKTKLDYDEGALCQAVHCSVGIGTHMDAPAHFIPGGRTIDQIDLDELVLPACVIDITKQVEENPDYTLMVDDLKAWEEEHGLIPPEVVMMIHTGWEQHWDNPTKYLNKDQAGVMHFPGISSEAANYLIEREIVGVGIDTLSVDAGQSSTLDVHRSFLGQDMFHLENLSGLGLLPATGITLFCMPMKGQGLTEAPARVFAVV